MKHVRFCLKASFGFSLVEVLIASALISIVGMGILSLFGNISKEQKRTNFMVSASIIRSQLFGLIEDSDSWKKIVNESGNVVFKCLRDSVDCNNNEEGGLKVLDQAGTAVFDSLTEGYTWAGVKCLQSAGTENCPVRVNVKSILICPTPTCASPAVKTIGTFSIVSTSSPFPFNNANYSFESYRKAGTTMGGNISIITPKDIISEVVDRKLFSAVYITSYDPSDVTDPAPGSESYPSYWDSSPACPTMKNTSRITINGSNQIVGIGGTFDGHIFCSLDATTGACRVRIYKEWNCSALPPMITKQSVNLVVTPAGVTYDGVQYPWLK